MVDLKQIWEELDPNHKKWVSIGSAGVALVAILATFVMSSGGNDSAPRARTNERPSQTILTDQSLRGMTIDHLTAELRKLKADQQKTEQKLMGMEAEKRAMQQSGQKNMTPEEVDGLVQKVVEQELERRAQIAAVQPPEKRPETVAPHVDLNPKATSNYRPGNQYTSEDNPFDKRPPVMQPANQPVTQGQAQPAQAAGQTVQSHGAIREISDGFKPQETGSKKDEGTFLPAGSIIDGVLVTGLDAGTNKGAQENPYPALLRIKADAILPNRYRMDVKECFALAAGYGELSSERVYLRSETLSCVRKDGGVIEVPINMYAAGEDGKAGIRGRLVTKQGQLLAKSLQAGFLQGVAGAFNQQQIPAIATVPGSTAQFQSMFTGKTLQAGVAEGFGSAFDRLSKFYMNMAEQMFPILEVDAGRRINFIVMNGVKLKLANNGGK